MPEAYLIRKTADRSVALEDAMAGLDEAVIAFLSSADGEAAVILPAVFRLDNEIGRISRSTGGPSLKSLQLRVNDVAVAAKKQDRAHLATAMDEVRTEFLRVQKER